MPQGGIIGVIFFTMVMKAMNSVIGMFPGIHACKSPSHRGTERGSETLVTQGFLGQDQDPGVWRHTG